MNRWTVLLLLLAIAVIVAWKLFSSDTEPDASDTSVPAVQQVTQPLTGPNAATSDPAAFTASPLQFTSMRETSDIDFVHVSGDSAEKPFPAANGSGIAALDYDLDGNVDLYFATGTTLPTDPARENPTNRCYRNLGGWQFQDVTDLCGLGHNGYSAGLAVGDFNSDGFPDVYVTCFGENQLYQNRGDGTFQVVTEQSGTGDMRWATSAACMDYDNDGLTDLYVCNYGIWSLATNQFCGDRERDVRIFCSPGSVPAERDVLFHNEGDGSFRDVTMETGLGASAGRGQGIIAVDVNEDGLIDLYVGNDQNANFLFQNSGHGTFHDSTENSGAAYDFQGSRQAGMGVAAGDVDRNGRIDLFVTNFGQEHNTFYSNMGGAMFQDMSRQMGLASPGFPDIGWGTAFVDFDLDGWLDVVVANGHVDDNLARLGREGRYEQPPLLLHNIRGRFSAVKGSAGAYFDGFHCGRALVITDLDNDGDSDVVIGHQDSPPELLRNDCVTTNVGLIQLRMVGTISNRDAVGTMLVYHYGDVEIVRHIVGGGSYLSANDLRVTFPCLTDSEYPRVEIHWPSGRKSSLDVTSGGSCVVLESRDAAVLLRKSR